MEGMLQSLNEFIVWRHSYAVFSDLGLVMEPFCVKLCALPTSGFQLKQLE